MKSLVVFYSLTGNTSLVASKIAAILYADTERIHSLTPYEGGWGYLKAAYHSLSGRCVPIQSPKLKPDDYDLVIVAGPIWTGRIAPPVHTYLRKFHGHFARVAFCITCGGSSPYKSFQQMEAFCGAAPVATLALTAKEIAEGQCDPAVGTFVRRLEMELGQVARHVA
jgi:flavodoxin